jgi:hypothetical protein
MIRCGELAAIQIGRHLRVVPEVVLQAEAGLLAVRPIRRRKETVPKEIADLLRE